MAMDVQAPGKGKKSKSRPEMNVTPLVDVVLVLLIIFMVVMPSLQRYFWLHIHRRSPTTPTRPRLRSHRSW